MNNEYIVYNFRGLYDIQYEYKNTYLWHNISFELFKSIWWTICKYGFSKVNWRSLLFIKLPDRLRLRRHSAYTGNLYTDCVDEKHDTLLMRYCFLAKYYDYRCGVYCNDTHYFYTSADNIDHHSNLYKFKLELNMVLLKKNITKNTNIIKPLINIICNYLLID
jgi:hypothetical protein